jgi:hypothetical protein
MLPPWVEKEEDHYFVSNVKRFKLSMATTAMLRGTNTCSSQGSAKIHEKEGYTYVSSQEVGFTCFSWKKRNVTGKSLLGAISP